MDKLAHLLVACINIAAICLVNQLFDINNAAYVIALAITVTVTLIVFDVGYMLIIGKVGPFTNLKFIFEGE